MAKWSLHRLWARYQLLIGIFGIAHMLLMADVLYELYSVSLYVFVVQASALQGGAAFSWTGLAICEDDGKREGHASSEGDLGLSTATADYPSSKCICDHL